MQDKNLKMQNIDEQRRATTGNDISAYDEVVTKSGIPSDGIYDESFPSSRHNTNERLSGKLGKNFNFRWHRDHFDPVVLTLPKMLSQQVFFGYSFPRETFGDGMYKRWHS